MHKQTFIRYSHWEIDIFIIPNTLTNHVKFRCIEVE